MIRVVQDTPSSKLENAIGEYLEEGWTVIQIVPSSWSRTNLSESTTHSYYVTGWLIVLSGPPRPDTSDASTM